MIIITYLSPTLFLNLYKMNKSELLRQNQTLVSQQQKFPRVFAWKTGALVLMGLIAIMLIVNIILLVYLGNHPVQPNNLSFVNQIVMGSDIIKQGSTVRVLLANMLTANSDINYQFAELLAQGTGSEFQTDLIKDQIFGERDHNLLFIFQAKSGADTHIFALYSSAEFPFPEADQYDKDMQYYSFTSGDNRKSLLLSLEQEEYLKANSSNKEVEADPRLCKEYTFSEKAKQFSILDLFQMSLDDSPTIEYKNVVGAYRCFDKIQNDADLILRVQTLTGCDFNEQVTLEAFEVFYLDD